MTDETTTQTMKIENDDKSESEVTQLKLDLTQLLGAAAANSTLHARTGRAIHVQIGTIGVSTFVEVPASGHTQTKNPTGISNYAY